LVRLGTLTAGVVATIAYMRPETGFGRAARRARNRLVREGRYVVAGLPGLVYRLEGRRPDPDVGDDVLVDRIRSSLGPLERRLDVPRVHVMVADHVAILHGEVPDERDADVIEQAVMRVSGVQGVESHLHIGLTRGDTRPSDGRAVAPLPSVALQGLLDAAEVSGAQHPRAALHAVLSGFLDRLPDDERAQVFAHLPADVRALARSPRRRGQRPPRLKTVPQLVAAITGEGGIEPQRAETITRSVLAALHAIVRDEARDISAVLPAELRELWDAGASTSGASSGARPD
jgi:uncharacterized protein (DUF2267 family)